MYKAIILFFSLTFLVSCENSEISPAYSLILSDSLSIKIGSNVDPSTFAVQYHEGNLYWWNQNRSSISKFDLETGRSSQWLKYEYEGPNGIGNVLGFHIHSEDSIFIPASHKNIISLVNNEGKLLNKFDYDHPTEIYSPTSSLSRYGTQFTVSDGKLFFQSPPNYIAFESLSSQILNEYIPFLHLDISEATISPLSFRYGSELIEGQKQKSQSAICSHDGKLYFKHLYSRKLYIYDIKSEETEIIELPSTLLTKYSNEYEEGATSKSVDQYMNELIRTSASHSFHYDPYRDVFYELAWPGEELPENAN
ncbi:DUF4221 family protein [Litoribacter alkaliphilus]|uniref:DUF4221 family protein n=1 Tax=Litoribacter ruber TaxID=702568 RepID=A0AAP2CFW1_9BACT|nr:DUF4221 family protein [Litoribacter alkaliphilus]MBS9523861.1 DUF4221 family protein [Litoribacter alkaliphilus]